MSQKVVLGALALSVVAVANGLFAIGTIRQSKAAEASIRQSIDVLQESGSVLADVLAMQAGYLGFLSTGDETSLALYEQGRVALAPSLDSLRALTLDNPSQGARWRALQEQADYWVQTSLEPGIQRGRENTFSSSRNGTLSLDLSSSEALAAAIRTSIGAGRQTERLLLEQRTRDLQGALDGLLAAQLLGIGVLVVSVWLAAISFGAAITRSVGQAVATARQIAAHDLPSLVGALRALGTDQTVDAATVSTHPLVVARHDELGQLAEAINGIIMGLREASDGVERGVQRATRERNALLATIDVSQDAILILDPSNTPVLSNARYRAWFGSAAAQDTHHLPAHGRSDRAEARPTWITALLADAEAGGPRRVSLDAGTVREVEAFSAPIRGSDGSAAGRVFVLRDASNEAELARTKDELIAVVSHELRTPMASLLGFTELLLARQLTAEKRRQYLMVMLQEGRRLTSLINSFLDLQGLERGVHGLHVHSIDLRHLLEAVLAADEIDPARPVVLNTPEDIPSVLADPERLRQVLTNLLSNAHKYSPQGGTITVAVELGGDYAVISVQDEGLGIPAEAVPRLFKKFSRVDNSDRRTITGTGLGLAISHKIVEAHGGRIRVESEGLGRGSRFVFTVPLVSGATARGDVLVVEDDQGFGQLLVAELTNLGHRTERVSNAEAALLRLEHGPVRIIVLDLALPGLEGETFLERLRQGGSQVPVVVVISLAATPEQCERLQQLGAVAVLMKGPGVASDAARIVTDVLKGLPREPDHMRAEAVRSGRQTGHPATAEGAG